MGNEIQRAPRNDATFEHAFGEVILQVGLLQAFFRGVLRPDAGHDPDRNAFVFRASRQEHNGADSAIRAHVGDRARRRTLGAPSADDDRRVGSDGAVEVCPNLQRDLRRLLTCRKHDGYCTNDGSCPKRPKKFQAHDEHWT